MKKDVIDLIKILNETHENKWVALSSNKEKVLGSSENIVELKNKVNDKNAIYMKVQPSDMSFAF